MLNSLKLQELRDITAELLDLLDNDIALSQDRGAHIRAVQQRDAAKHLLDKIDSLPIEA